jgi:hypothetical protein
MLSKYSKEQLQTAVAALNNYKEGPFIRYEWEELVSRLCHINDPALREKMGREMETILEKDPAFKDLEMI